MGYESMDGIAFRMEAFGLWLARSVANVAHSRALKRQRGATKSELSHDPGVRMRSNVAFRTSIA